jgi:hypothetical protein
MHEDTRMQWFNYTSVLFSRYIYSMITFFLTRNLRASGKVGCTTSEGPVELPTSSYFEEALESKFGTSSQAWKRQS